MYSKYDVMDVVGRSRSMRRHECGLISAIVIAEDLGILDTTSTELLTYLIIVLNLRIRYCSRVGPGDSQRL